MDSASKAARAAAYARLCRRVSAELFEMAERLATLARECGEAGAEPLSVGVCTAAAAVTFVADASQHAADKLDLVEVLHG